MISSIKNLIAIFLYKIGLLELIMSTRLRNKAIVLMYHRILTDGNEMALQPGMYVSKDTFEKHVKYLKKRFDLISLTELVIRIRNKQDVSKCCIITFDDGWRDSYENAFPILKENGAAGTIFLTTGFMNSSRSLWFEEVSASFSANLRGCLKIVEDSSLFKNIGINSQERLTSIVDKVVSKMKSINPEEREEILTKLHGLNASSKNGYTTMMEWDHAREMLDSKLIDFGAHTVNHVILDQVNTETAKIEILESIKEVKEQLNVEMKLFSYPNGTFNNQIVSILKENDFDCAVTTQRGYVDHGVELMQIPRISVHEDISCILPRFLAHMVLPGF